MLCRMLTAAAMLLLVMVLLIDDPVRNVARAMEVIPAPEPVWEEVCTATSNTDVGTQHPAFCHCSDQCKEAGSGSTYGCSTNNEVIVYIEGVPYCRCDCPPI